MLIGALPAAGTPRPDWLEPRTGGALPWVDDPASTQR